MVKTPEPAPGHAIHTQPHVTNGEHNIVVQVEDKRPLAEMSADEIMEQYGHLAVAGTRPEMPQDLRHLAAEARKPKTTLDEVIELRKKHSLPRADVDSN